MKKVANYMQLTHFLIIPAISIGIFYSLGNPIKTANNKSNFLILKNGITNHIPPKLNVFYSPSDPYYTGEKVVNRAYQNIMFDHIADDMESVWDNYTGKNVTIAVIDTGLDMKHVDLNSNISDKSCSIYTLYNKYDYSYETRCEVGIDKIYHDIDEDGNYLNHGSSVAGVIAARNNDLSTIGIAYEATLLIIKCDLDPISINEAIIYAADNGADVINMSFGGYAEPYESSEDFKVHDVLYTDYDPNEEFSMVDGLNYAHKKGIILVAATGNEATSTQVFPAANKNVIAVGALDKNINDDRASFSNYNETNYKNNEYNVDISAPGYVIAPYPAKSSETNDEVSLVSGSSFAAPIISAAACLWKQKYPNGTPYQFEQALYNSAYDIGRKGFDVLFGNGRVNISKLLDEKLVDDINEENEKIIITKKIELTINEQYQLKAEFSPSGKYNVSYTSSTPEVATIDNNGKIKATGYGKTYIAVKTDNSCAICLVNVVKKQENTSRKCGGEIIFTSSMLSMIALIGFALLNIRKRD